MSRARRLATLVKLSSMAERNGRRLLGQTVAALKQNKDQQQLLSNYQVEYGEQLLERGRGGISGMDLRRAGAFQQQLAVSIEAQGHRVANCASDVETASARWRELRVHQQNMGRLLDLEERNQERLQDRRVQRELDDAAGRNRGRLDG